MQLEILEFAGSPLLKYVQQHDVNHGFNQNVCSFRTHVRQFFHESGIVVVFYDAEA